MDDPRIEWIRNQAYLALAISDSDVFEQLLDRDDGEGERNIAKFINDTPTDDASSLLFYKVVKEEEDEVEVECGTFGLVTLTVTELHITLVTLSTNSQLFCLSRQCHWPTSEG